MLQKIRKAMLRLRPVRTDRREFNGQLLDQRREDVYVLLHQQMTGMY
jgi:hypothetical protein